MAVYAAALGPYDSGVTDGFVQLPNGKWGFADAPTRCPECGSDWPMRQGPPRVYLAGLPCRCSPGVGHITYRCASCDAVTALPDFGPRCKDVGIGRAPDEV